jgi:hypothetical protein
LCTHWIIDIIDRDSASATKIEDTHFTALAKEIRFERIVISKRQSLNGWDGTSYDSAVEVGVNKAYHTVDEELIEQKGRPQLVGIENRRFAGRWHQSYFHDDKFFF